MAERFNLGRLWRLKDGRYRDINGNIVGDKGGLTGAAWKYLKGKYGSEYANRVSWNMRNGNIYWNGRWRADDAVRTPVKHTQYGDMFRDKKTGRWTYYNQDRKDRSVAFSAKLKDLSGYKGLSDAYRQARQGNYADAAISLSDNMPIVSQVNKGLEKLNGNNDNEEGITTSGGYLASLGAKAFGKKLNPAAADILGTAVYFTPAGNLASLVDAGLAAKDGRWGDALLNTLFAVPIIGQAGRLAKGALKASKAYKKAKPMEYIHPISNSVEHKAMQRAVKLAKFTNNTDKYTKPINKAMGYYFTAQIPGIAGNLSNVYHAAGDLNAQSNSQYQQLQNEGLTDNQIRSVLEDTPDNNLFWATRNRGNNFNDNIKTTLDLLQQ